MTTKTMCICDRCLIEIINRKDGGHILKCNGRPEDTNTHGVLDLCESCWNAFHRFIENPNRAK